MRRQVSGNDHNYWFCEEKLYGILNGMDILANLLLFLIFDQYQGDPESYLLKFLWEFKSLVASLHSINERVFWMKITSYFNGNCYNTTIRSRRISSGKHGFLLVLKPPESKGITNYFSFLEMWLLLSRKRAYTCFENAAIKSYH